MSDNLTKVFLIADSSTRSMDGEATAVAVFRPHSDLGTTSFLIFDVKNAGDDGHCAR